jgi:hypothetical protein
MPLKSQYFLILAYKIQHGCLDLWVGKNTGIIFCRVLKFVWLLIFSIIQVRILKCKVDSVTYYKRTCGFCVKNLYTNLQNPGEVAVLWIQINCRTSYLEQFIKRKLLWEHPTTSRAALLRATEIHHTASGSHYFQTLTQHGGQQPTFSYGRSSPTLAKLSCPLASGIVIRGHMGSANSAVRKDKKRSRLVTASSVCLSFVPAVSRFIKSKNCA